VAFVNAGAGDLHIQGGSTARNVGADLSALFTTDIDAAERQSPWDIGADEVVGTPRYRSVGTNGGALASGAANALTISGSTATFGSPLPNNVGVGDVIQYDSDGNNSIDALAFIHGRTGARTTVANRNGAAPREWLKQLGHLSGLHLLASGESTSRHPEPVETTSIPARLVSSNATLNVALRDGRHCRHVAPAAPGDNNRITPYLTSSASQRHSGTWNATTAYRLQAAPPINSGSLWIQTNYVRVDGLQIWQTNDAFYTAAIYMNGAAGVSSYEISNNIVRGIGGAPSQVGRIGINTYVGGTAGSVAKIWNNLVYDFTGIQIDVAGILLDDPDFTVYVYNNTVVDGSQGIAQYQGTVVAKNNLAYNNLDNYNGTFNAASTNNLSGPGTDAQIPATNKRDGVAVTFVNAGLDDLHLSGGDRAELGHEPVGRPNMAISDIDRRAACRPGTSGRTTPTGRLR
jgi:hypothetical protein